MSTHISRQSYVSLCASLKSTVWPRVYLLKLLPNVEVNPPKTERTVPGAREWLVSVSLLDIDVSGFYLMARNRVFTALLAFSGFSLLTRENFELFRFPLQ